MPDLDMVGRMGPLRIGCVALILIGLPLAALAAPPRVALLEAGDNQVPRGEAAGLRADIEEVVRALGAEAIPSSEVKAAVQADCREPACMKDIQRATSATHVLRVAMTFRRDAFNVQMQLWDASTGQALSSDGKACDECTLADLHAAVREQAKILCTRVFHSEAASPAAAAAQAPVPRLNQPVDDRAAEVEVPRQGQSAGERAAQVAGLALAALGVAAAAYGGYLLHLNGKTVCRNDEPAPCAHRHVTGGRGVGWLVGGMGALFAGSILFYTFTW